MPNTPNLTLQKPYILILSGGSVLEASASGGIQFGEIRLVYQTADAYAGGDTVAYKIEGKDTYTYQGVEYDLVREENVLFKENYVPTP